MEALNDGRSGVVRVERRLVEQETVLLVDGHALCVARIVDDEPARAEAE